MALKRLLVAFAVVLVFLIGSIGIPAPASKISPTATNSVVRLQLPGGDTYCSGFVINPEKRYVMTADHCLRGGPPIVIRRAFGQEIWHNEHMDASIVQVAIGDPLPPALKADLHPPYLDQPLAAFGYAKGKGMKRIDLFVVFPRMMFPDADGTFVLMSPNLIAGMSGGPIVSERGVVGINMAGRDDPDLAVMRPIGPIYQESKSYWSLEAEGGVNVEVHP